jgi:lysozyme
MADLAPKLKNLASKSYHFVAFLGSCYSGGIFTSQQPGGSNDWYPKAPGAHAVSSTPHDDLAYGLGDADGSIFFDSLIEGVKSGRGDVLSAGWVVGRDRDLHRIGGGIVRLGALTSFISQKIDELGNNPKTGKPFPQILIGSLSGTDHNGAFFFVGPPKEQQVSLLKNGTNLTLSTNDTGSSLFKNSDIKVFSAPDSYSVAGIDVSHYNGPINWKLVARAGYAFAYMKATESVSLKDERFAQNWSSAKEAGLIRGAYHVFDYCADIGKQFSNIQQTISKDSAALPIALDLVWSHGPENPHQRNCANIDQTRARIMQLNAMIEAYYKKTPIIFANQSGLNELINDDFNHDPIWLQLYGDPKTDPLENLKIKGSNPWTVWQHSSRGRVPGISGKVDLDVFFGNKKALEEYAGGIGGNPALQASQR